MTDSPLTLPVDASADSADPRRLPWLPLILLALIGFVLLTMETVPAGLLPLISSGLDTDDGTTGLLISAYALGTVVVTIPAIALTRGFPRKPLLLVAIVGLVIGNTATAIAPDIVVALIARLITGAFSGIIWGMLAAYAARISPTRKAGLALAIISIGAPLGFAIGTPLGTLVGTSFGWRWAFAGLSGIAVLVVALMLVALPSVAAERGSSRLGLGRVIRIPGVGIVLAVIVALMLGHNTTYTYIAPYLRSGGTELTASLGLFVYGIASVVGVVIVGALIDRFPRALIHASLASFVASGLGLLIWHESVPGILIATAVWGATFGGAPTQLQAALTSAGGSNADVANAFYPVAFNVAIFAAGVLGAGLLTTLGPSLLPLTMVVFGTVALALSFVGRRSAFPSGY